MSRLEAVIRDFKGVGAASSMGTRLIGLWNTETKGVPGLKGYAKKQETPT